MTDALEFLDINPRSPWWGDHRSRYHFAGNFVRERNVLDVACGSGLGFPILNSYGVARILGVDISKRALEMAQHFGGREPLLLQADAHRLPVQDGYFGAVTSFETLEHVQEPGIFLSEIKRVLSVDGVAVLSTPNALWTRTRPDLGANPYHLKEYEPQELRDLLGRYFNHVELYGQMVHPRFRPCPYWETSQSLPGTALGRVKVMMWKAENRLPAHLRDKISLALRNRPFLPDENGFVFNQENPFGGHVVVAVCR